MKWLKLDCDFRYDPKIQALMQQFGGQSACSFWILLLSYVGLNGMPQCEIQVTSSGPHSPQVIASWTCTKPHHTLTMLSACANLELISSHRWDKDTVIAIPNMLKRIDDYTRKVRTKSVQSPESHTPEQNKNIDKEVEQIQTQLTIAFEVVWGKYPVKDGRKAAERHFHSSVKTLADVPRIELALTNYLRHLKITGYTPKNGSTWFNNWTDYENWVEPVGMIKSNGQQTHKTRTDWNLEAAQRIRARFDQQDRLVDERGDFGSDTAYLFGTTDTEET